MVDQSGGARLDEQKGFERTKTSLADHVVREGTGLNRIGLKHDAKSARPLLFRYGKVEGEMGGVQHGFTRVGSRWRRLRTGPGLEERESTVLLLLLLAPPLPELLSLLRKLGRGWRDGRGDSLEPALEEGGRRVAFVRILVLLAGEDLGEKGSHVRGAVRRLREKERGQPVDLTSVAVANDEEDEKNLELTAAHPDLATKFGR